MVRKIPPPLPSVFALGLVCQIGQILMLRELLMVFHGNELSIGIVLAAWMFWVGIGSRWGCLWVERLTHPFSALVGTAVGILVLMPVTLTIMRGLRGLFDVLPGAYLSLLDIPVPLGYDLFLSVGYGAGLSAGGSSMRAVGPDMAGTCPVSRLR